MALSGELHFRMSQHHLVSGDSPSERKTGSGASSPPIRAPAPGASGSSGGDKNAGDLIGIGASTLNAVSSTGADFRSFLNTDVDLTAQKELFQQQLQSLQALKRINRIKNQHELAFIQTHLSGLALAVQEQQRKVKAIHQVCVLLCVGVLWMCIQ